MKITQEIKAQNFYNLHDVHGPINILANSHVPSIPELQRLGVARVSVGSGPMQAAMALVRTMARELLELGTYSAFTAKTIPYTEMNQLFIN